MCVVWITNWCRSMLVQLNMLNHVIWAWVKIGYSNHWMVNTKDRPTSLVPEVLNFDPYPYGNNIWIGGWARPRGPGGCMKYQFVCLNGWAGQGKTYENLLGGSLKYLFGYFKVRIFKSSYRILIQLLSILWSFCRTISGKLGAFPQTTCRISSKNSTPTATVSWAWMSLLTSFRGWRRGGSRPHMAINCWYEHV